MAPAFLAAFSAAFSAAGERFQAFSAQHFVLFGVLLAGCALVVWWGRRHRGTERELRARRTFAVAVAVVAISMQAYQLTPGDFDLGTSLPLQLSDLADVAAVVALWTRSRRATAFTYYVGLTLTVQAVLTPSLAEAFPDPRYFGFWLLHFSVIWAAVYLTWGLGLRPTWRLYGWTVSATVVWALMAFAFNQETGTNYGYLNRKPPSASLLDLLGPWPWYVVAEVIIVAAGWALLLTLPWTLTARRSSMRRAGRSV